MTLFRLLIAACLLLCTTQLTLAASEPAVVRADQAPVYLSLELSQDKVFPGTPITLNMTVLVSTWMPRAPLYPDLEINNVMLRLPSNASRSFGDIVDGERWNGTTRSYLLYPMAAGQYTLPSKPITITYADPQTRQPQTIVLQTPELDFEGVLPQTSPQLEPFVGAHSLTMEQNFSGPVDTLEALEEHTFRAGDAITRTITVHVDGTSPVFLPPIQTRRPEAGLTAYPKEPELLEDYSMIEGISGSRSEEVTFTFEEGGRYQLPEIELRWYNLDSGEIESAKLEAITLVARLTLLQRIKKHWRLLLGLGLGLGFLALLGKWLLPPVWQRLAETGQHLKSLYLDSEPYAYRQAQDAIDRRDLGLCLKQIAIWRGKIGSEDPASSRSLTEALTAIGADTYHLGTNTDSGPLWAQLEQALKQSRRDYRQRQRHNNREQLPPLNP